MSKDSALSRALARIDELEAENTSLRGAIVVKPNERLVFIAPEHISQNGLLQTFDEFYRRHCADVIVLSHDWRTLPIDELRAAVARTERAQESTGGCIVVDHRTDPPMVYDGRHMHEWTPTKDSFGAPTETCFVCRTSRGAS